MANPISGQIFTFYSYKGGTGRSMALANVACLLAEKKTDERNVLMIDWDLEAPGLHRFFQNRLDKGKIDKQLGLIDLFYAMQDSCRQSEWNEEISDEYFDKLGIEKYIINTEIPSLCLMTAGLFDSSYPTRVNRFNWESFFDQNPWLISKFAEYLEKKFRYVLIDSRTGFTDISSVCTALMPERLVLVFTPNIQSLTGVLNLVENVTNYRKQSSDLRPLIIFPLVSRVENAEEDLQKAWRHGNEELGIVGYQPEFEKLLGKVYDLPECDLTNYFNEVKIQHVPKYSYGEEIAVLSTNTEDRLSLAKSYDNFTQRLVGLDSPWESLRVSDEALNLIKNADVSKVIINFYGHGNASDSVVDQYVRNRKLRVFLSHSSSDKPIVRELYQELNAENWIDPWLDEETLLPGQDWDLEIEKAVKNADVVLVCLSTGSVTKEGYIQRELRFALDIAIEKPEETLFVIPLRLDDCEPPRRLKSWHYLDYFPSGRREKAYELLLKSLRLRAEKLGIDTENMESQDGFVVIKGDLFLNGKSLKLSKRSKALLMTLINSEGQVVSNKEIRSQVFSTENPDGVSDAAIRECVRRLKNELLNNKISPELVETIRGKGYILNKHK